MRTIGINLHAAKGLSDEDYLREAAGLGFGAIFSGVLEASRQRQIGELCARYGLVYETLHAPFGHMNDIWLEDDAGVLEELRTCVDHCVMAGAGIAVVHLSSGENPPPVTDRGRARFETLVEYAASRNVRIAFENQRKLANLAWAMEAFGPETVGFCWDCGHERCFTPGRHYMPLFGNRLICTHIHDNMGVYNEDLHLLPFDGNGDFSRVAQELRDAAYTGSLMLEVGNAARYGEVAPQMFLERAAHAACRLREMVD